MMARLARAGDEPPDVEQDHHGRPEHRHRPVPTTVAEQQDHEERDGDQVGGLVDLAEELLDPAELPPPDPHDEAGRPDPPAGSAPLGFGQGIRLGVGVVVGEHGRFLAAGRHPVDRERRQAHLLILRASQFRRRYWAGDRPGFPPLASAGIAAIDAISCGPGDRHVLAALLAVALLAGHPRIDLEPRAATLAEKHDVHRALPFVMTCRT